MQTPRATSRAPLRAQLLAGLLLCACGGAAAPSPDASRDRVPRRRAVDRYVAMLESPGRTRWQRPEALVESLRLSPAATVADVGTGSGYFLPHLSRAVPRGRVVGQDIDPELVEVVRRRVANEGLSNVEPRLGEPDDPRLEAGVFDLVLMVDVYHHVARPAAFLAAVKAALAPGGRVVVVDFAPGDHVPTSVSGADHRITPARVAADLQEAGFVLLEERAHPPYQFVVEVGLPRGPPP